MHLSSKNEVLTGRDKSVSNSLALSPSQLLVKIWEIFSSRFSLRWAHKETYILLPPNETSHGKRFWNLFGCTEAKLPNPFPTVYLLHLTQIQGGPGEKEHRLWTQSSWLELRAFTS